MKRCENCRFYIATPPEHCRRNAPHRDDGTQAGFPVTLPAWWCGEHRYSVLKLFKNLFRRKKA